MKIIILHLFFVLMLDANIIDVDEQLALCELKTNFNILDLYWNKTIAPNCDNVCSWNGVTCEPITFDFVTELDLTGIARKGRTLPVSIGNFKGLKSLTIQTKILMGTLPTQLGLLTKLNLLYLGNNTITEQIPTQFGMLIALSELDLSHNQLEGTIPTQLGYLTNLNYLDLSNNQLEGTIPTQLGYLTNLDYLDLSNNQLNGTIPTQIINLNILIVNYSNNPDLLPINPFPINLEVNQTLNLSDGNYLFESVNISSGSLFATNNANLTTTTLTLSENSILSITNSTIFVQENITIPTGFTLSITNPTSVSLGTSNCINIQPNTTLNISLPSSTQTNNLTLISFQCKTGTFSKININNECGTLVENKIAFILTQNSNLCTHSSTQAQEILTIYVFAILFISLLL